MNHLFFLLFLFSSPLAFAAPATTATAKSNPVALGVADTSYLVNGQSVSLLLPAGGDTVQLFLSVQRTNGSFDFGGGSAYKFTVAGDRRTGFHVGPAVGLGSIQKEFAFSVAGLAGGHFTLFDRLVFSVDGGPILRVVDGDADFRFGSAGEMLGFAVHYQF